MGSSKKNRSKKSRAAKAPASSSAPAAAENNVKVTIDIYMGGIEYLEGSRKLDDANGLNGGDAGPQGSLRYELAMWSNKSKAVEWFKAGCDQDHSAEMWFDSTLNKDQRKELHTICGAYPNLKSVSRGTEAERQIGIVHASNIKWDIPPMCDLDETKARALLAHLRDLGQPTSVDEVRGMIASHSLTAELEATVNQLVKDQQEVSSLLDAIADGQSGVVQSLLSNAPGTASVKQHRTGKLPLHAAASVGDVSIMGMLVGAGASLEQTNGKDQTALQAARAAEQCEAEGWLIQQGAQDPEAKHELTEAANFSDLDSPAPAADTINGQSKDVQQDEDAVPDTAIVSASRAVTPEEAGADVAGQDAAAPATPDPEEAGNADLASSVPAGDQLPVQASAATEPPDPLAEDTQSDCGGDFATMTSGASAVPKSTDQVDEEVEQTAMVSEGDQGQSEVAEKVPETEMPKVNRVPEIEPAPPRPAKPGDDGADYEMSIEQDEENGIDVLVAWAGNAAAAATDFCGKYPAVVATAGAVLAVAGAVLVKLASGNRR